MFRILSELVLFFMIVHVSECKRRIIDGKDLVADKTYMVYIVKGAVSEKAYDFWLCGGAIVSSEFVITSAACVNDVDYLYVISGYKKYVVDSRIDFDECTSRMKKKVIYTCSPKGYQLKYGELDYWSYIDIALVRVESPFDFANEMYTKHCDYKPTSIPVNYEKKYQEPGTDALVLGWGHATRWRRISTDTVSRRLKEAGQKCYHHAKTILMNQAHKKPKDTNNYNVETLKYASTLLLNTTICMEHYEDYSNMSEVIETYMICSLGKGNIDDQGNTIVKSEPLEGGCTTQQEKVLGFEGLSCEPRSTEETDDDTRRQGNVFNKTYNSSWSDLNNTYDWNFIDDTRRTGFCQNDHGGPLVTWAGSHEILIGVASVFKVADNSECMGPFLYTSTLCTGLFIDCVLTSEGFPDKQDKEDKQDKQPHKDGRRELCDKPASERGYDTIERYISWRDHPAGPADNEKIGRSGPVDNFAASEKYSASKNQPPKAIYAANANFQEETKYQSNKMYSTYNNPALYEGYAFQEKYPENVRYPGKDMYQGNEKYPGKIMSQGYGRYPVTERYPINEMYPANERNPANERYPGKDTYQGNERYPIIEKYPATSRYPINEMYPANERYPANQMYPANQRYPPNERYPGIGRDPVNVAQPQFAPTSKSIVVRPQRPLRN